MNIYQKVISISKQLLKSIIYLYILLKPYYYHYVFLLLSTFVWQQILPSFPPKFSKYIMNQIKFKAVSPLRILYLIFPCKTVFSYAANLRPLPLNVLLNLLTFAILPSSNTHTVILKKCHPILNVVWSVPSILS